MSSPGDSKASRGGKENLYGDRTSGAVQGSISKDSNYSIFSNVLTEESKTPILESGIRLGSINEREIVDWINYWDEVVAEHPTYPFVFANSMSAYVKYKLIVENDIQQGYTELNRASLSQLAKWLSACVRPVDNISFIEALDKNVFFPGKRNIVLTEKNYREFYENLKEFSRDFALLLGMLKYSLYEDQEHPPMNTRDGEGILSVYLKKIPCEYGWAVWRDMPKEKKYKKFSEFLTEFMKICQKPVTVVEKRTHPNIDYRKGPTNSLTADVVVNETSVEVDIGNIAVDISVYVVDVTKVTPTIIAPVLVLEEVVPSTISFYGLSVDSYNVFVMIERVSLRPIVLMLLDAVRGTVVLFGGWSKFIFSEGFRPGPPKKPPPWNFLFRMLFNYFGFNSMLLY